MFFLHQRVYLCLIIFIYFFMKTFFHCLCPFLSLDNFQNRPVLICFQQKVILSCEYDRPLFSIAVVLNEYLVFSPRYKKVIIVLITPCKVAY